MHLVAPGWNVIGGGEPALPGVSIGHNEHGAWGLTIFGNDNEDLYVYDTNPANAERVSLSGPLGSDARRHATRLPVKGEKPETVELKYTRHGPVLFEDRANRKAYALRAAWLEQGGAPYLASLRMDQATTWEEFREACSYNRMPAENMVWADRTRHRSAGRRPAFSRCAATGAACCRCRATAATSGTATCRSRRCRTRSTRARGFIGTANNYLFPNDYPWKEAVHFTVGRSVSLVAHHRDPRLGSALQRRRDDAPAERRPVAARARAGAAAARSVAAERRRRRGRASCCTAGTSCSTRTRSRPASTRCGSGG